MGILPKEARREAVERIQAFFRTERGEEIGELGAGTLLDVLESELGRAFYNKGVQDAKALVLRSGGALAEELEYLDLPAPPARRA